MLIGTNASGKSNVVEALEFLNCNWISQKPTA
ncbi:MAG: AAA family ATPase [Vulcanococcus sp.]